MRRRTLPILYKALEPGNDDDRMKGALWTLNGDLFGTLGITKLVVKLTIITAGKYAARGKYSNDVGIPSPP